MGGGLTASTGTEAQIRFVWQLRIRKPPTDALITELGLRQAGRRQVQFHLVQKLRYPSNKNRDSKRATIYCIDDEPGIGASVRELLHLAPRNELPASPR